MMANFSFHPFEISFQLHGEEGIAVIDFITGIRIDDYPLPSARNSIKNKEKQSGKTLEAAIENTFVRQIEDVLLFTKRKHLPTSFLLLKTVFLKLCFNLWSITRKTLKFEVLGYII